MKHGFLLCLEFVLTERRDRNREGKESIEDRTYGDAIGHRPLRGRCPKRRVDAVEAKEGPDVKQQLVYHG